MSVSFSYFVAFGFVLSKLVVNDDIKGLVMMIKSRFSQTSAHFLFGKSNERKDRETEKKLHLLLLNPRNESGGLHIRGI